MADLATLQQWKTDAESALQRLMSGASVQEITAPDGSKIVYNAANTALLEGYIAKLDTQIAAASGGPSRRPLYFVGGR